MYFFRFLKAKVLKVDWQPFLTSSRRRKLRSNFGSLRVSLRLNLITRQSKAVKFDEIK